MNSVAQPPASALLDAVGLIAGNGHFPILFAQAARAHGVAVIAVGMRGETLPSLQHHVDKMLWVRVGQLGRMIDAFTLYGVRQAAMAGGVKKNRLFAGARPDWRACRLLMRTLIRGDDNLLRSVAAEFEGAGVRIVDSTLFMPDALTPPGVLTGRAPNRQQWDDLYYGLRLAQQIGRLDVGQTVVVKRGTAVALEAMEGTDACIRRAGTLLEAHPSVVVKVAKPAQDMRFDVPVVGMSTLDSMQAAGATVLGLEAGRTLLLEPQNFIAAANARHICVVGLSEGPPSPQAG